MKKPWLVICIAAAALVGCQQRGDQGGADEGRTGTGQGAGEPAGAGATNGTTGTGYDQGQGTTQTPGTRASGTEESGPTGGRSSPPNNP